MEKAPTSENSEATEISASEAIRGFYQEHTWAKYDSVMRAVGTLEDKDPEFLEKTWGSTKDLRETAGRLSDRAIKRIKEFGIEFTDESNVTEALGGMSTPKGGKLDAPNFLLDPMGYEKYMAEQGQVTGQEGKTIFSGLAPEQSAALLGSLNEFWEAKDYIHKASHYQFRLLQGRGIVEEIKEQQGHADVFSQLSEKLQFPYTMLRAHLDGKLAKLHHAPKFAYDKFKSAVENFLKESE